MKLYVDASAILKLLVEEDGSEEATTLAGAATEIVVASIGYVEARSALARATRLGRLPGQRRRLARDELETLWAEATVLELELDLVQRAGHVAELARLRAGDAIHLATALALDEPDLLFVSWDGDLRRAAGELGLAVAP